MGAAKVTKYWEIKKHINYIEECNGKLFSIPDFIEYDVGISKEEALDCLQWFLELSIAHGGDYLDNMDDDELVYIWEKEFVKREDVVNPHWTCRIPTASRQVVVNNNLSSYFMLYGVEDDEAPLKFKVSFGILGDQVFIEEDLKLMLIHYGLNYELDSDIPDSNIIALIEPVKQYRDFLRCTRLM